MHASEASATPYDPMESDGAIRSGRVQPILYVVASMLLFASGCWVGAARSPSAGAELGRGEHGEPLALAAEEVPSGIHEGLEIYMKLFPSFDPKLLPELFHEKMSMSALMNESDLHSFTVFDYEKLKGFLAMAYPVASGQQPVSTLPAEFQPIIGLTLFNALPTVKHYRVGPSVYVTLIKDMMKTPSGQVVTRFRTNLHWIKTPAGWRIKDKIYATLP